VAVDIVSLAHLLDAGRRDGPVIRAEMGRSHHRQAV
jgi:hypothetical protein